MVAVTQVHTAQAGIEEALVGTIRMVSDVKSEHSRMTPGSSRVGGW